MKLEINFHIRDWINSIRWRIAEFIQPKTEVTVFVENMASKGIPDLTPVRFNSWRKFAQGSGQLYYTNQRVPYLTIRQQMSREFRDKLQIADLAVREGYRVVNGVLVKPL